MLLEVYRHCPLTTAMDIPLIDGHVDVGWFPILTTQYGLFGFCEIMHYMMLLLLCMSL